MQIFVLSNASIADRATRGAYWRIIGTILIGAGFLVAALIWIGFYAVGYDPVQKIIVFLIALILAAAAISILWVSWAGRRGWMRFGPSAWHE